ncbi:MAG: 4'-phosphopantetheinyl transferase superfamily protein [Pseudoxanthomonas sp.]
MAANAAFLNPRPAVADATDAGPRADLHAVFSQRLQTLGWNCLVEGLIAVALIDARRWGPWLNDASGLMSAEEWARVQRRRVPADRDALALAYALHRLLLGSLLGVAPRQVPLGRDELGCPRLAGDVAYTSLSHSDELIALAVTGSGPVGVDIEPTARAVVMPEITRSVCHPTELAQLGNLDESGRAAEMLALWVRKEALLKMAGIGLGVSMETFVAPDSSSLMLPALFSTAVQVRMLDAGDQCLAAVAGPTGMTVDCQWLHPPARLERW